MQFRHDVRPYYARLAETMLRSWIGGDIVKLRRELDSTANSWWWPKNQMGVATLELRVESPVASSELGSGRL